VEQEISPHHFSTGNNVYTIYKRCISIVVPALPTKKRKHKKDSQLIIRINGLERNRFIDLCNDLDTSAAREIRRFIRDFMQKHADKSD